MGMVGQLGVPGPVGADGPFGPVGYAGDNGVPGTYGEKGFRVSCYRDNLLLFGAPNRTFLNLRLSTGPIRSSRMARRIRTRWQ